VHEFTDQSWFVAVMVTAAGAIMELFTDEV
jgi:hypothetical protein